MASSTKLENVHLEQDVADFSYEIEPLPEEIAVDSHDPLTWNAMRKVVIMAVVGLWILLGTTNMIIIGSALQIIPLEFKSSFASSTYLVGGPLLAYGVSSWIWVPIANRFGVRLIFVLTSIAAGCMCCWAAKATSFGSLVAARTLASAFYAPPETPAPQLVGDVFYLKDRSKAMTFVGVMQASGFAGGPLVGAFIVQNHSLGWRWVEWILAIITFFTALCLSVLLPETQYTRNSAGGTRTRTWVDELRFWPVSGGGPPKDHSVAHAFATIFPYLGHPVVLLNMGFFSLLLLVDTYLLTTQAITYLVVYPFTIGESGLTFIAPLIGSWLAMTFSGVLADRLFIRLTNQERRKPPPERRLPLLIVTGILGTGGTILFGACTQERCHWVGPLFGSAFLSFCFISGLGISFAYLLDVYEARMDSVMVVFNGVKNLAAFGISYAIVPWNMNAGYTVPSVVLAAIVLGAHLLMLLVYFKGEAMRKWTIGRFDSAAATRHGDAF